MQQNTLTFNKIKKQAGEQFSAMPWPTTEEEEWRRTDLSRIPLDSYSAKQTEQGKTAVSDVSDWALPEDERIAQILFIEGATPRVEGGKALKDAGVTFRTYSLEDHEDSIKGDLGKELSEGLAKAENRVQVWHYTALSHGVYLNLPDNLSLDKPVVILFKEGGEKQVSAPHVTITAGKSVAADIAVLFLSGDEDTVVNAGADIKVGANSKVNLNMINLLGPNTRFFSHVRSEVARDGRFLLNETLLGGKLVKTKAACMLNEPGAHADLDGIYFCDGAQHMDIGTVQHHGAPHTTSDAFYKGAMKDQGRGIFRGLITVTREGEKTDAYLSNKNLVLNPGARADSIPTLNILTNDVRCSHGSTTGKIDPEQLYYLMTRGFSKKEAEKILILGFFDQLLGKVPGTIADRLRNVIVSKVG